MNKGLKFLLSYMGWVAIGLVSVFLPTIIAGGPFHVSKLFIASLIGGLFGMLFKEIILRILRRAVK